MKLGSVFILCLISCKALGAATMTPIVLEHAITEEQRERGLMGRYHLDPNQGMLFHFPKSQIVSFWMYNTYIDLSLGFLDEKQILREIYELTAYPNEKNKEFFLDKMVSSKDLVRYALEMNKNWFNEHGIKPGDRLVWDLVTQSSYFLGVAENHDQSVK